jgi:hypothetical protein
MQLVWFVYGFWFVLGLFLGFALGVMVKGHYNSLLVRGEMVAGAALKSEEQYVEEMADKVAAKLKARLVSISRN